jgi:hypothetical protein
LTVVVTTDFLEEGVVLAKWGPLANGENGNPAQLRKWPTKTVQVFGTLGVGGSISIQGSNDGTNWVTLRDSLGVALTFTALGLRDILENCVHFRAIVTAGDGTTALSAWIVAV